MQQRTRVGRLAVLAVVVVICSSVGAGADLVIDGLDAEGVNETFTEDAVRFQTSYMNQSLDPQQVFVPDALVGDLDAFSYSLQSFDEEQWPGVAAQLFLQVQYATHWSTTYPSENLSVVLGNDDTVDTSLTPHQFVFSDSTTANRTGGVENVFDTQIADGPTTVSISVDAHYEHLLITYTVRQNETVVWKTTDVYSGEEPDRVAFTADAEQVNDTTTRQQITLDNQYGEQDSKVVGLVYDSEADIQEIDWNGLEHTPVSVTYDGFVKPAVVDAGLSNAVILDDVLGMKTAYYNVTVPADSTPTVTTTFRHPATAQESGNDLRIQEQGPFYTYIIGSGGALKVTSSQELCGDVTPSDGSLYDRVTIDATVTVCNRNSSGWTGQLNITTNDWINVTQNGVIDGEGAGNPWWNGTGKGENGTSDHDEDAQEFVACGGGGGGYGGAGGTGGNVNAGGATSCNAGSGGSAFSLSGLFDTALGSSGGKGGERVANVPDGASGGASIFLRSRNVLVHGILDADGKDAQDSTSSSIENEQAGGGSGGGSGGTITVHARVANVTNAVFNTTGGDGGDGVIAKCVDADDCEAAGGSGGGGGRARLFWQKSLDDTGLSVNLDGGFRGMGEDDVADGRNPGNNGTDGVYNESQEELNLNHIPTFSQTLYRHDRKAGEQKIEYSINDGGESDIRSYTGLTDSTVSVFTNSSLHANATIPFNAIVEVFDRDSASNDDGMTNITETDSGIRAHSFTHTLSEQRFNQTVTTTNNGPGSITYNQTLDLCGTVVQGPTWQNSLSSDQSATHTGICTGDWVVEESVNRTIVNDTIVDDGTVFITVNRTYTLQNSAPASVGSRPTCPGTTMVAVSGRTTLRTGTRPRSHPAAA